MSAFDTPEVDLSPAEVRERLDRDDVQLIDVRESYEWDAGHIAGARHVEMERLANQAPTIDRDKPVIFHCRLGARSAMAAQAFRAAGYDAYTMVGGLERWHQEGLPMEPEDGQVAAH